MKFETRLTPALVERWTRAGHWGTGTFSAILARQAEAHTEREALVDRQRRVTYRELADCVERLAVWLQQAGIGPGDVVTIQLPNRVEFANVFFACERVGAVANQIGHDFRSREVEYILRFSESRAFVCPTTFKSFDYVTMIRDRRPGLPDLRHVVVLDGGSGAPAVRVPTSDVESLDALIAGTPAWSLRPCPMGANDVGRMAFTSGTTGNPKG